MSAAKSHNLKELRAKAQQEGELPHEFLRRVAIGEAITQRRVIDRLDDKGCVVGYDVEEFVEYPNMPTRIDAAKACAAFYAPRLSSQQVGVDENSKGLKDVLKAIGEKLPV